MFVLAVLIALLVVVAVTYWLHRRLVVATGLTGRWRVAADAVLITGSVLVVAAFLVGSAVLDPSWARPIGFAGYTWLAVVFYLILGCALIGVIALVVRLIARLTGAGRPDRPARWLQIATGLTVVGAVVITGYGLVEANRVQLTDDEVTVARLPEQFDGLRIAFVTDLHVGPARSADFTRRVVEQVNAAAPDLVVLGGDLADGTVAAVGADLAPLRDLRAPLGVYGVSGNHEYISGEAGSWLDHWETLGVTPLRNQRVLLDRAGAQIDLSGVDDYSAPEPRAGNVERALADRDEQRALIHLAHQPRQARDVAGRGVGLQLSGHTHGGQLWPFGYAVAWQQPVVAGTGTVGDVPVFVSRGTGAWGPPVRVAARPQIAMVTLRTPGPSDTPTPQSPVTPG